MQKELPDCPVELTVQLLKNKWTILVIRDLLSGTKLFNELIKSINGITQKVLTSNLHSLENSGLLVRNVYPEVPPRVKYTLTDTGYSLQPVLNSMAL
ncbi:MAG: winged helix-turn-helix transcriptional regulator [Peptostreptococcaceae bacterium]